MVQNILQNVCSITPNRLSGTYDFDLEFAGDDSLWGGMPTKGPVETLIIDRAERQVGN